MPTVKMRITGSQSDTDSLITLLHGLDGVEHIETGSAEVATRGKVSLALTGTGQGYDLGVAASDFRIMRQDAGASKRP
ncbi:hypothetical protein [Frateuria defendens]|uniref:hypothetical protein n=1 Tax=Frateuria defendens TaxID=2219559 RepID=UPI00066FF178|nr:hypothetical protein [Frateuria defendens]